MKEQTTMNAIKIHEHIYNESSQTRFRLRRSLVF